MYSAFSGICDSRATMEFRPLSPYKLCGLRRTSTDIRFGERRIDRVCAICDFGQQTWQETDVNVLAARRAQGFKWM